MLNLLNASQSYVADIVDAYSKNDELKKLTSTLQGFTKNLEGVTYDFNFVDEYERKVAESDVHSKISGTQKEKVKITISQSSIDKLSRR